MDTLALLLKYQWIQTKNSLKDRKAKLRTLFVIAMVLGLAIFIGRGLSQLFTYMDTSFAELPGLARTIEASILSLLCLGVFFLILTSGLKMVYERTFESDDLVFLLSSPVSAKAVFASKLLGSFFYNLQGSAIFILPAWIAYGLNNSAPVAFYPAAIVAVVLGALLVHSLLALLILLIMRFVPSARLKKIFIALSSMAALVIVFVSQIISSKMAQDQMQNPMVFLQQVGEWGIGKNPYLPHLWMSRFALSFLPSFNYSPWANGLPLVLVSLGLCYLAITLSGSFFLAGWGTKDDSVVRPKKAVKQTRSLWPKGSFMSVIRKEFLVVKRDPLLWYNLLVITIVLGFFVYNMSTSAPSEAPAMTEAWVMRTMALMMPAFMGSILISQLGGISISREGQNWWFLCSSPIEPQTLYLAKLTYAALIPALYGIVFQLAIFYIFPDAPFFPPYVSIPMIILINLAVAAAELMLDILFPDFTIKIEFGGTAGKASGTTKLLISMFLGFASMFLFGGTISLPAWGGGVFKGFAEPMLYGMAIAAFIIEIVVVTGVAAKVSVKKLDTLMRNL